MPRARRAHPHRPRLDADDPRRVAAAKQILYGAIILVLAALDALASAEE